jgi:hypothetical protein
MKLTDAMKAVVKHQPDEFATLVRLQNSRLTGVNRKLLGGYQKSPARYLPKSKAFKKIAGAKQVAIGGMSA